MTALGVEGGRSPTVSPVPYGQDINKKVGGGGAQVLHTRATSQNSEACAGFYELRLAEIAVRYVALLE